MEDTLEDVILVLSLNLLMSDDQYDPLVCIYIKWRGENYLWFVWFVLELKPSMTQISLMGLEVLVVLGKVYSIILASLNFQDGRILSFYFSGADTIDKL